MNEEQSVRLLALLERIAKALEIPNIVTIPNVRVDMSEFFRPAGSSGQRQDGRTFVGQRQNP